MTFMKLKHSYFTDLYPDRERHTHSTLLYRVHRRARVNRGAATEARVAASPLTQYNKLHERKGLQKTAKTWLLRNSSIEIP